MFKKQEGITLVALVITIIVLLILAGVSISLVVGNNGVLTQASTAVVEDKIANAREALNMALAATETLYYGKWTKNTSITRSEVYGTAEANQNFYDQLFNLGYTLDEETPITVGTSGAELKMENEAGEQFIFTSVYVNEVTGKAVFDGKIQIKASGEENVLHEINVKEPESSDGNYNNY